jgi:hypothetical protein
MRACTVLQLTTSSKHTACMVDKLQDRCMVPAAARFSLP